MNKSYHIVLLLIISMFSLATSCSKHTVPGATPVIPGTPNAPKRTVNVNNASALKDALQYARPGDEIVMADGTYSGKFVIPADADGTTQNKIILRGSRNAILNGGNINSGYVLHAQADHWVIKGFTITNGKKAIMADGVNHSIFDSLYVHTIGEEGIHLRKFSSNNIVRNCTIFNLGLVTPDYGEGVYIGTAKSNWASTSNGEIDKCDSNKILNNIIGPDVAAECIDIKEGTTGGLIAGNTFYSKGLTGANSADSWMDVKGNYYLIENNIGHNEQPSALNDGFQVNCVYAGWGSYNEFKSNTCNVHASGYGINIRLTSSSGQAVGNKVYKNNTVTGAAKGVSNIPLSN